MKRTFIAMQIKGGKVSPHDHPVFKGDVAYDLNIDQEIPIDEENQVREFVSAGEAMQAVTDYLREEKDGKAPGVFYLMEKITVDGASVERTTKKVSSKSK